MSQKRKIRKRAQGQQTGKNLQKAMGDVQTALSRVDSLQEIPEVIDGLKEQTKRASLLADAMADDYETLLKRIENIEVFLLSGVLSADSKSLKSFREKIIALTQESAEQEGT